MPDRPPALIIAGPTCSGKSALALALAARRPATIINADSMQVYADLPILTAQPTAADHARTPHALYGTRPAADPGSVAQWREDALAAMHHATAQGRLPILCGGTGLYLAALTHGLAPMPPITPEARAEARALLAAEGPAALHARLAAADPVTAATLRPTDPQRLARAWEVLRSTGTPLATWQATPGTPAPYAVRMILLDPPRNTLRAAIADRFHVMLAQGALAEAAALHARHLDPALPALRAHGVPELLAHLDGLPLDQAATRAIHATNLYTKRQATWFRHRSPVPAPLTHTIHARFASPKQFSESEWLYIESFISGTPPGGPP